VCPCWWWAPWTRRARARTARGGARLGARRRDIVSMVMRQDVTAAATGIALGVTGATAMGSYSPFATGPRGKRQRVSLKQLAYGTRRSRSVVVSGVHTRASELDRKPAPVDGTMWRDMSRDLSRDLVQNHVVSGRFARSLQSLYGSSRGIASPSKPD
jgi:hypothetical protein